ncbi:AsmA family protein [Thermaurantimonas aggregans]|nr:AsmA-like C-terminal region-containing protein [Thermaurantimonas aggregans]MCX8149331.1 AsmA-like C-terminal region-containing protein [Thermaurantimonas aggregans]
MNWIKKAFKAAFWIGIAFLLLAGGVSLYFYYQKDKVIQAVIRQLNDHLAVPIEVYKVDVSFKHFPHLAVVFTQVRCTESTVENPELLLKVENLYIKFSLLDVVYGRYYINEIGLENGYTHIKFFEDGSNNFTIFKTDTLSTTTSPINIEKLYLNNIQVTLSDFRDKIFTSQQVFTSDLSTSFSDSVHIKGFWNAQNMYVRTPDILFEDKISHSAVCDFINGQDFISLKLENATIDRAKFDLIFTRENSKDELSFECQNQKIFSNPSLQKILSKYLSDFKVKNDNISAKIHAKKSADNWAITSTFNGSFQKVLWTKSDIQIDELKAKGSAHYESNSFEIKLSELAGRSASTEVTGTLAIQKQKSNLIDGNLAVKGEPNGLAKLAGFSQSVSGQGAVNAQVQFRYRMDESTGRNKNLVLPEKFECVLRSERLNLQIENNSLSIPALHLSIDKQGVNFQQRLSVNDRNVNADLQIKGLAEWLVDSTAFVEVRGVLEIDAYDENFWKSSATSSSSPLAALDRTLLDVQIEIGTYTVKQLKCTDIQAKVLKQDKNLEFRPLTMNLFGGTLEFEGNINTTTAGYTLNGKTQLRRIDLTQLMLGFNNFEQKTLTHKNLQGKLSGTVQFSLPLAADLDPDVRRISAEMDLRVQNGRLIDFEPMDALGRFADVDVLKDIRFDELNNRLKIENQLILIPQFEIRSNALNLILEGTHSFENAIDYKVGLSLSDVLYQKRKYSRSLSDVVFEEDENGARIWIRISGTTDEPKISPIKAELVRSRNQLFSKPKQEPSDSTQPTKPTKSPFKFEWDEN